MAVISLLGTEAILPSVVSCCTDKEYENNSDNRPQSRYHTVIPYREGFTTCLREIMSGYCSIVAIVASGVPFAPLPAIAEDSRLKSLGGGVGGVVGALKSLFDPDETMKSGKNLPKACLKSAKDIVNTLCESLKDDPKDMAKFGRTADSARESIRNYLSNWRGNTNVESYAMLEKAIRTLARFYSKAGPSAPLPEEIKLEILNDLTKDAEFL